MRINATAPGRPLIPGMTPRGLSMIIQRLGTTAAVSLRERAAKVTDLQQLDALITAAHRLDAVSPHQLRHSLARRLLHGGAQLPEVQRILGHSRLSTTGMYLTPSEDDLRGAIERMEI